MKVDLTASARLDLKLIAAGIAEADLIRSFTFVDELVDRCHSLSDHPRRFPVAATMGGREVRKMTHGNYLIFYVVSDAEVSIVRIVHGARDWARLFAI